MATRKAPESINRLDRRMRRQLEDYVLAEYIKSGLSDVEFAKQAEKALQFPLTHANIAGARDTFNMLSNRDAQRELMKVAKSKPQQLLEHLKAVEARLTVLEDRVSVYISGSRKNIPEQSK